ncbi:MAG TPA: GTP-binding protein [Bryobacteraceae bacterium]|nr:GTP-binding protein [Bryobacteraceae bacterium]
MPDRPALVLTGGFLSAGKTTLLLCAARMLHERGMRTAIITNDQGGALVDTRMATAQGFDAGEIAGACFCCRFGDFVAAAQSLLAVRPDVIFAEPVGSCMDLSATVLQPLKQRHVAQFRLAPFSVLVDPRRAAEFAQPDADPQLAYLFHNQLAEADLVVYTKSDLVGQASTPAAGLQTRHVSAVTGQGVAAWLDEVLNGRLSAGTRLLDIDYAQYAAAEAALGWLNWEGDLRLETALTPAAIVGPLLERLDAELTRAGAPIVHLKIFDRAPSGYVRAAIGRNGDQPSVVGDLLASPARRHELVVNLRARALPAVLEEAVARATAELPATLRVIQQQCFQPSPPVPEYRYDRVSP